MRSRNKANTSRKVYVCFDGYNDFHYFQMMRAWKRDHKVDFDFYHAQNLNSPNAGDLEKLIKSKIEKQIQSANVFVVLIGESTRYLSEFVQWEMERAIALDKPIIGVNLNGLRYQDPERCPPIIRDQLAVHISFHAVILQEALVTWPDHHTAFRQQEKSGPYYYDQSYYNRLGL